MKSRRSPPSPPVVISRPRGHCATSAPKSPPPYDLSDLRRELYTALDRTLDRGLRSAYLLLIALVDRHDELAKTRPTERSKYAKTLTELRSLKIRIEKSEIADANKLWLATPVELAQRIEAVAQDLTKRFVALAKPSRRQRPALEREARVAMRAVQNNSNEAREMAHNRLFVGLQTMI